VVFFVDVSMTLQSVSSGAFNKIFDVVKIYSYIPRNALFFFLQSLAT